MPQTIRVSAGESKINFYVNAILDEYNADVAKGMQVIADECANEAVEQLKSAGSFKGKKYRKAWTSDPTDRGRYAHSTVVHLKKPHYRLAHLLEFGHAKQNGGRTRAFIHIQPIADEMTKKYEKRIEEMFGRI